MKIKSFIFMLMFPLGAALFVPAVNAAGDAQENKPSKTTLKRFDKNKDGVLSAEEETAWNAAKEKERARRAAKRAEKQQSKKDTAAAADK